ncbi:MAG: hypothetical protein GWN62_14365, partial [Aliifodinibius sp.]|nr:hypothetical protein [Fodinibius sp.]
MRMKSILLLYFVEVLMGCNVNQDPLISENDFEKPVSGGYLTLYLVEEGIKQPVGWDSIPYIAKDSLIIPERYVKTLSPSKMIDFKEHYTVLNAAEGIDLTLSGSVTGCENRLYWFSSLDDSVFSVTSFVPGPSHYLFTGGIPVDPGQDYPPLYALFIDEDDANSGIVSLRFENNDTVLTFQVNAAQHTMVMDESVYRFKLNHIRKATDFRLYLYYIDGISNRHLSSNDPFFLLFPIVPAENGERRKFYKVINITPGS